MNVLIFEIFLKCETCHITSLQKQLVGLSGIQSTL